MQEEIAFKILQLFSKRLFERVGILFKDVSIYHTYNNTIEYNIDTHGKNEIAKNLKKIFTAITKKSSVGNRFKLKITASSYSRYGIRMILLIIPEENENSEELITLLRLEGLI